MKTAYTILICAIILCGCSQKKWEYETIILTPNASGELDFFNDSQKKDAVFSAGYQGWEMVTAVPQSNGKVIIFFKRPMK